jgi:hypothetical protein
MNLESNEIVSIRELSDIYSSAWKAHQKREF